MRQLMTTAFEDMRHETPRHSTTFRRSSNRRKTLMPTSQIRFDDGATYERYMGKWSQLAGKIFLDWLAPKPGLRWLDVGCGNGAFTEMLVERCEPVSVKGSLTLFGSEPRLNKNTGRRPVASARGLGQQQQLP